MPKHFKFGRWWFTKRKEAETERKHGESIYSDSCQDFTTSENQNAQFLHFEKENKRGQKWHQL